MGTTGLKTMDGPPGQRGTEPPFACALELLLLLGNEETSDGSSSIGTEEGKEAIVVEEGTAVLTIPKPKDRLEHSWEVQNLAAHA